MTTEHLVIERQHVTKGIINWLKRFFVKNKIQWWLLHHVRISLISHLWPFQHDVKGCRLLHNYVCILIPHWQKKNLRFNFFLLDIYMQFVLSKTTREINVVSPAWPPGFSSLQHVLVSPVQLVQLALLFPWTNLSCRVDRLSSSKLMTWENRKTKTKERKAKKHFYKPEGKKKT